MIRCNRTRAVILAGMAALIVGALLWSQSGLSPVQGSVPPQQFFWKDRQYTLADGLVCGEPGMELGSVEIETEHWRGYTAVYTDSWAKGEAIAHLKLNEAFHPYRFASFTGPVDARAYLELYGIRDAEDVEKITVERSGFCTEIIELDKREVFLDGFGLLVDSQSRYQQLVEQKAKELLGEDAPDITDWGGEASAYPGMKVRDGACTVTIHLTDGTSPSFEYLPQIGFLGNWETKGQLRLLLDQAVSSMK